MHKSKKREIDIQMPKARGDGDCGWTSILYSLSELDHPALTRIFGEYIQPHYSVQNEVFFSQDVIIRFKEWFYYEFIHYTDEILKIPNKEHNDFEECIIENAVLLINKYLKQISSINVCFESEAQQIIDLFSQSCLDEAQKLHRKAKTALDKDKWAQNASDATCMIDLNSLNNEDLNTLFDLEKTPEPIKGELTQCLKTLEETGHKPRSTHQIELNTDDQKLLKTAELREFYKNALLSTRRHYWCTTQELKILAHLLQVEIELVKDQDHHCFNDGAKLIDYKLTLEHISSPTTPPHYNPLNAYQIRSKRKGNSSRYPIEPELSDLDDSMVLSNEDKLDPETTDIATNTDGHFDSTNMIASAEPMDIQGHDQSGSTGPEIMRAAQPMDIQDHDQRCLIEPEIMPAVQPMDIQGANGEKSKDQDIIEKYNKTFEEVRKGFKIDNFKILHALASWLMCDKKQKIIIPEKKRKNACLTIELKNLVNSKSEKIEIYIYSVEKDKESIRFNCSKKFVSYTNHSSGYIRKETTKHYALTIDKKNHKIAIDHDAREFSKEHVGIVSIASPTQCLFSLSVDMNALKKSFKEKTPAIIDEMTRLLIHFNPHPINNSAKKGDPNYYHESKISEPQALRIIETTLALIVKFKPLNCIEAEPGCAYSERERQYPIAFSNPTRDGKTSWVKALIEALNHHQPTVIEFICSEINYQGYIEAPLSNSDMELLFTDHQYDLNQIINDLTLDFMTKNRFNGVIASILDNRQLPAMTTHYAVLVSSTGNSKYDPLRDERGAHPIYSTISIKMNDFFNDQQIDYVQAKHGCNYVAVKGIHKDLYPSIKHTLSTLVTCLEVDRKKIFICHQTGDHINTNNIRLYRRYSDKPIILDEYTSLSKDLQLLFLLIPSDNNQLYLLEAHKKLTCFSKLPVPNKKYVTKGMLNNVVQNHFDTNPIKASTYSTQRLSLHDFTRWLFPHYLHRQFVNLLSNVYINTTQKFRKIIIDLSIILNTLLSNKTNTTIEKMFIYKRFLEHMKKSIKGIETPQVKLDYYDHGKVEESEYCKLDAMLYDLYIKMHHALDTQHTRLHGNQINEHDFGYFQACYLSNDKSETIAHIGLIQRSKESKRHCMNLSKWIKEYQFLVHLHMLRTEYQTYSYEEEKDNSLFSLPNNLILMIFQFSFDKQNNDKKSTSPYLMGTPDRKYPSNGKILKGQTLPDGKIDILLDTTIGQDVGPELTQQVLARSDNKEKSLTLRYSTNEGLFNPCQRSYTMDQLFGRTIKNPTNNVCAFTQVMQHVTPTRLKQYPNLFASHFTSLVPEEKSRASLLTFLVRERYIESLGHQEIKRAKEMYKNDGINCITIDKQLFDHTYQIIQEKICLLQPQINRLYEIKIRSFTAIRNFIDENIPQSHKDEVYTLIDRVFTNYMDYINSTIYPSIKDKVLEIYLEGIVDKMIPTITMLTQLLLKTTIKERVQVDANTLNLIFMVVSKLPFKTIKKSKEMFTQLRMGLHMLSQPVLEAIERACDEKQDFFIKTIKDFRDIIVHGFIESLEKNHVLKRNTYNGLFQVNKSLDSEQYCESKKNTIDKVCQLKKKIEEIPIELESLGKHIALTDTLCKQLDSIPSELDHALEETIAFVNAESIEGEYKYCLITSK